MKLFRALPPLVLGVLLLNGCGGESPMSASQNTTEATYAGETGVQSETNAMPSEFEIDTYGDGTEAKADISEGFEAGVGLGDPSTNAEIDPGRWFRLIRRHERRFVIEFEKPDSNTVRANVKIVDRLRGTFNVITKPDTVDAEGRIISRQWIQKPLADTGVRKAVFERHRIDRNNDPTGALDREDREDGFRDGWSRWHLIALSGAEITSDDGTRVIESVRVQAGDVDATITDPLELKRVRAGLLHLPPATPVMVTVQTSDPTDFVVLYVRWGRMRLRAGDVPGTFVGRFRTPADAAFRHFAVNALSHGTLFEDNGPYDSKAWGIPFIVGPTPEVTAQN